MLTGSVNVERYIKTHTTNIKLNAEFVKSSYKNIVNSTPNKVEYKNQNYGIEIRSGFTGIFNYNFGTTWKHNKIVASNSENSFINNESFLDLTFIANKKLDSKLEAETYYLG